MTTVSATAVVVLLAVLVAGPAAGAATARGVPTGVDGWYRVSAVDATEDPTCALPSGCVPAPALPDEAPAEDTLQVARTLGRDRARAFFSLDVSTLPAGALVSGGQATLPVASAERMEDAAMLACVLTDPPTRMRGAPEEGERPPGYDCETSAPVRRGGSADRPVFTVDLAPFSDAIAGTGIAIVPVPDGDAATSWRVAFFAKGAEADDARPITATVTYTPPPPPPSLSPLEPGPGVEPARDLPGFGVDVAPAQRLDVGPPPAVPEMPETAPVEGPLAAAPGVDATGTPVAALPEPLEPFLRAYPIVWLTPLLVAMLVGMLGSSLSVPVATSPATGGGSLLRRLLLPPRPVAAAEPRHR